MNGRRLSLLLTLVVAHAAHAEPAPAPDLSPVKKWIQQQREVRTIQADFVQTRALRTLRSPVTTKGRFWFRAPDSIRWQIGDPPKTIVLGTAQNIFLIQPAKKSAEKSPPAGESRAQEFGMMSFPMAADFEEFQRRFEILSVQAGADHCRLEVLPRDPRTRRMLAKIALDFNPRSGKLLAFEVLTREGSSLRSEFRNVIVNGTIATSVFDYNLTGYHISNAKP